MVTTKAMTKALVQQRLFFLSRNGDMLTILQGSKFRVKHLSRNISAYVVLSFEGVLGGGRGTA